MSRGAADVLDRGDCTMIMVFTVVYLQLGLQLIYRSPSQGASYAEVTRARRPTSVEVGRRPGGLILEPPVHARIVARKTAAQVVDDRPGYVGLGSRLCCVEFVS